MRTTSIWAGLLVAMLSVGTLCAQDLTGDWQGTATPVTRSLRLIVHIEKADNGPWKATFANIDQGSDRGLTEPANVTVKGSDFRFTLENGRSYEGRISRDGNTIAGTLNIGRPLPLELNRATPATFWQHASPHSVQFVAVDQGVNLEVLDWGGPSGAQVRTLVMLTGRGNTAHVYDQFVQKLTPR